MRMNTQLILPNILHQQMMAHLFQNDLEQAVFLFARPEIVGDLVTLTAVELYAVPAEGWEVQLEMHLRMTDAERGKILKLARDKNLALIDCHSHPHSGDDVWFSGSDVSGTTDFAAYVNWKLDGKPFAAMVWGEKSVDAVMWHGDFAAPETLARICIGDSKPQAFQARGSWFNRRNWKNRYEQE
jgi:hypothetical protein